MAKEVAPILAFNFNLLFVRYVVMDINDQLREFLIFQWPWDSLETALLKRYALRLN